MLLLTAIVAYLTRGQMKPGVMNSMESIATRSARLQSQISNKEFGTWLARNERKILTQPELQVKDPTPLKRVEADPVVNKRIEPSGVSLNPIDLQAKGALREPTRREYLNAKYGRTSNLTKDIFIRGNRETALNWFNSQGFGEKNIRSYMNGLDFSEPVWVETINSGKKLWQYQVPGGVQKIWYSPTPSVAPTQLGINPFGTIYKTDIVMPRIRDVYQTTGKVSVLRSTSAPALDTWSTSEPFQTLGGARQITTGQNGLFKLISFGD